MHQHTVYSVMYTCISCVSVGGRGWDWGGMEIRVGSNIMIQLLYILLLLIWHMYFIFFVYIIHCYCPAGVGIGEEWK